MTLRTHAFAVMVALLAPACGDDGGGATVDARPDPCAPLMTFTGELLDWDSGGAIDFLGVYDASITIPTDTQYADITAPNGRFEMCIPAKDDVAEVVPMEGSTYVGGRILIQKSALQTLPIQSYRTFKATRAAEFGFDASLAHVFVHVVGGERTVTLGSAHTPAIEQVFANMTWSAGNTGADIYLGNIPLTGGAEDSLVVSGGDRIAPSKIPLEAGRFTYVTMIAQ